MPDSPLNNLVQIAYVTNDLDQAMDYMKKKFLIEDFQTELGHHMEYIHHVDPKVLDMIPRS